ncbi:DUF4209 domain-containing protein [Clostridium grantii]|uniref:DUF4209 domain-containing protein n=1 Tax=Clostridium grantii DSM 8605 TaxID=1121316 RepID=A0A1M5U9V8_9CLOT|nr:DUF4209 domain-containing protein [Clostridium grantii]SHH59691.1 protein of unknown function [Clostridium grantii DSM 8605]
MYDKYDNYMEHIVSLNQLYSNLVEIKQELELLLKNDLDEDIKKYLVWDVELLICCEIVLEQRKVDQNYLYPMYVYTNGNCIPDIDSFEEERLNFYEYRMEKIENIKLKIRYANYCFQYCIKKNRYKYSQKICTLLLDYLHHEELTHDYIVAFSRLFELGFSFNHFEIISNLNSLIDDLISKEYLEEQYLSLLSISRIIVNNIKNRFLEDATVNKIINVVERICNYYFEEASYNLYRNCCSNYLDWLKVMKRDEDIRMLSIKYGESYELDAEKPGVSNLEKSEWYKSAAEHYVNIGEREKVYHMKVKIKRALKKATKDGEFKAISTTQSIEIKQLEKKTVDFFKDDIESTLATVSHSSYFIISKVNSELKAVEDAKNPLYQLMDIGKIHGDRKVFESNTNNDLIKTLTFQYYGIELEVLFSVMFNFIWNKMIEDGLTEQIVATRICKSEYMDEEHKVIISKGIERMFEKDYIAALHILVPQFENYFRTFFEWGGFPTTSLKNNGLQYEKTFNEFLREDFVKDTISSDLLYMIEFVLVEQLGKNLRNNIAHGLIELKTLNKTNCLIMVYLFWMITAYKWSFPETENEEE